MHIQIIWSLFLALLAIGHVVAKDSSPKCDCENDVCTIAPPSGVKAPCYEGSNGDTDKCFSTDPLIVDGATKQCGSCESLGFPKYFRNDPLYKTMALFVAEKNGQLTAGAKDSCLPPNAYCTPGEMTCCSGMCPNTWQFTCNGH